jgi:hypothetical protein
MDRLQTGPGGESAPGPATPSERLAAALPRDVLTLDTLDPEPRFVRIDAVSYRISHYDDFSLIQHARFNRLNTKAKELSEMATSEDADTFTPEEVETLAAALDEIYGDIARLVLPTMPPETAARLKFPQKQRIVQAFLVTQAEKNARQRASRAVARPTGGTSSRRSAPGTATGATGKKSRRSATSSPPTATSPDSPPSTR